MGNAVVSISTSNRGQLALLASKACLCATGAALVLVSYILFTNEPRQTVVSANMAPSLQPASLHPPLQLAMSPESQSRNPAPGNSESQKNAKSGSHASARTSQSKSLRLAAMRGSHLGSTQNVFERSTAQPLPWGVHLTAGWSRDKALSQYRRMRDRYSDALSGKEPTVVRVTNHSMGTAERYLVRIGQSGRDEAELLCSRIKEAGGACVVYKTWHR